MSHSMWSWGWTGSPDQPPGPAIESLESRLLLSASLHHGLLALRGSIGDDQIVLIQTRIPGQIQVTGVPGVEDGTLFDRVNRIDVRAWRGDDLVRLIDQPKSLLEDDNEGMARIFFTLSTPIRLIARGGQGNDVIHGGSAADQLIGGPGNDLLQGGDGRNVLRGGNGRDTLVGGAGHDRLFGGAGDDQLFGKAGRDRLLGNSGDDWLDGGDGPDLVLGHHGRDVLRGGTGRNRLAGGSGKDWIYRQGGMDIISGARRDDLIADDTLPLRKISGPEQFHRWLTNVAIDHSNQSQWWHRGIAWPGALTGEPLFAPTGTEFARTLFDSGQDTLNASSTNVQETGVDEADIVENDGEYLFVLSGSNLVIADGVPAADLHEVSRTQIEGTPVSMYLMDDLAVVLSRVWGEPAPVDTTNGPSPARLAPVQPAQMKVTVLNVEDRANPTLAEATYIDGYMSSSRVVDGRLYVVMENNLVEPDRLWPAGTTAATFTQRLNQGDAVQLPGYTTVVPVEDGLEKTGGSLLDSSQIYVPLMPNGNQIFSLLTLDLTDTTSGIDSITDVVGLSGTMYASASSVYIVSQTNSLLAALPDGSPISVPGSNIYKFDYAGDATVLSATGSVPGTVLNQFSMSEHEGRFRIATTEGFDDSTNNLFVLEQDNDELQIAGSATDLGPNERIRSVRYQGDWGYVVTFRQTDPLFVLDLRDPANPHVVGELTIPGFSSYMQLLEDGYMLGIGRDADLLGRVAGVQLSLFDIRDPTNPQRSDVLTYGVSWSASTEAEYDHHAASYFAGYDTLGLPLNDGIGRSALKVIKVVYPQDEQDTARLTPLGQIDHVDSVRRSIRILDVVYSISQGQIKAHRIDDLAPLAALDL